MAVENAECLSARCDPPGDGGNWRSSEELIFGIIGRRCWKMLMEEFTMTKPCLLEVSANVLNYVILLGALLVKIPQIVTIASAKSVQGLSGASFIMEVLAGSLFVAYNVLEGHPFPTWGEVALVVLQGFILVGLYWCHTTVGGKHLNASRICILSGYVALMAFILKGPLPQSFIPTLGLAPVPFSVLARVPQIWRNFRQGHTGQLSFLTMFLMLAGNCGRIFTTLQQLNDPVLLYGNIVAGVVNGIPVLQIILYRKKTAEIRKAILEKRDR